MGTRTVLAIAVVAAVAVGIAIALRGGEASPLDAGRADGSARNSTTPEAVGTATDEARDPSERTSVAQEQPTAAPHESLRVTVVDDATGVPVAGAEVVGFHDPPDRSDDEQNRHDILKYRGAAPSWSDVARAEGRVVTTGPDGTADVPLPEERPAAWAGASLEAFAPGRFGVVAMPWREWESRLGSGVEIRIRPTHNVVVEVVDAAGHPVPAMTVLHLHSTEAEDREPKRQRSVSMLGRTDAAGIVVVEHFERMADHLRRDGARILESTVTARLCGAAVTPVPLPLDPLPTATVHVTLPPTGTVRLEFPSGSVTPQSRVAVRTDPLPREHGSMASYIAREHHTELLGPGDEVREGALDVLTLPHVAVGATLHVEMREWNNVVQIDERFAGPTRPGEIVTVRLAVETPVLCGRFVDGEGRPVATQFHVQGQVDGQSEYEVRPGADGRFRLAVDAEHLGVQGTRWDLVVDEWTTIPAIARIEVPGPLRAGDVDVGDVLVEPLPVLATGRCVDDTGAPVPRPGVGAIPVDDGPPGERRSYVERRRRASTRSLPDGTFTVHGTFDGAEIALVASAAQLLASERVVVPVGTRNITLVLPRAANAVATAVGLREAHDVLGRLIPQDGATVPATWYAFEDGVTTWMWSQIRPGRFRFELAFGPTDELLRAVDGVEIAAGGTTRDPRLQDLQLDNVATFRLRAVAADGGALREVRDAWPHDDGAHVFFRAGDAWRGRWMSDRGETLVNAHAASQQLLLVVPGYRPATATWAGEKELEVRMTRAPQVAVRVPDGARIETVALRGGADLRLETYGASDLGALDRWPGLTPRASREGTALFEVPEPGRYAIELTGPDATALRPTTVDVGATPRAEVALRRD